MAEWKPDDPSPAEVSLAIAEMERMAAARATTPPEA
jgi:hypothetical protein